MAEQYNSDIALQQAGSRGAPNAAMVLGARSGVPTVIPFEDLRWTANGANNVSLFDSLFGVAGETISGWTADAGSTGTATYTGTGGGVLTTAAAAANDHVTISVGQPLVAENGTIFFEAQVSLAAITEIAVEIGLSDAASETAGLAFSDHTVGGVTDVATDAVVVAFDTGDSLTNWTVNTSNNGTPQAADTAVAVAATTNYTFRLVVNTDGDVDVYVNGTLTNSITDAIATDANVGAWITCVTRGASARTLNLKYVGFVSQRG